jgi:PAS domain S-box-containing protein
MQQPYRILVVEDSPTQAESLGALFRAEGWEAVIAGRAEAAFDELNRSRPDLIVLDYHLPGMQGDAFCRDLRINPNTRGIPVLMLTIEGTLSAETRGLESGADDYLAKSAGPEILLLRVRTLLRKSRETTAVVAGTEDLFNPPRLLLIDDSPTYLQYLAQELSSENYRIEQAGTGQEGLDRFLCEPFDCVLVDVEMPGVDGIEVCRRVAALRRTTGQLFSVIILTEHEEKEVMTRGLEAGADDFIVKSIEPAVLKSRIRALLRRKFFVDENRRIQEELKNRELETVRARAEKDAAEVRAAMAGKLAQTNRELEEANRRLREALEVTRAITENTAEALFLTGSDGRVTFSNPAATRMFGYTAEEFAGQSLHDKIHHRRSDGSPFPAAECSLAKTLAAGGTLTAHEDVFIRKDGVPLHVVCSVAAISEEGHARGAVLAVHDVSERKRAEERLRQSQKLESIGLLAGGIAHDFNNLLVGVIGSASLAQDLVPPGHPTVELLERIVKAGEQAAHLTRQMLAYSGKGQFLIEPVDLSAVVRETSELIKPSLSPRVVLHLNLTEDLPPIQADRSQIQQVFMNLAINAAEAIGDKAGLVAVRTGAQAIDERYIRDELEGAEIEPGSFVYLEVRDTGCGMDAATRAKIFDPFFTTKFTGRGLGLAAVAGIVRGHKGAVSVSSAPGKGSRFLVLFRVEANKTTRPEPAPEKEKSRANGTVLVVDDEAVVRQVAQQALARSGYEVLLAEDGPAAVKILEQRRGRIDLVILDAGLPGMSGRETLEELERIAPDVSVVVSSGRGERETLQLFSGHMLAGFIEKPYTGKRLAASVAAAIGKA